MEIFKLNPPYLAVHIIHIEKITLYSTYTRFLCSVD